MTDGEGPWKSPSFKRWAEEEEENRGPWGQVTPERSEEEEGMDGGEDGRCSHLLHKQTWHQRSAVSRRAGAGSECE